MYHDNIWGLLASLSSFDVTPDYLIDGFIIVYSDNGSNDRTKEESIVYHGPSTYLNAKVRYNYSGGMPWVWSATTEDELQQKFSEPMISTSIY